MLNKGKEMSRATVSTVHVFFSRMTGWLAAAVYAAVGVCMILFPDLAANLVVYGIAAVLIVMGVCAVISYIKNPPTQENPSFALVVGMSLLALGAVIACWPGALLALLAFLSGAALIAGCFLKFQMAFDAKRWGRERWWFYLIGAGVSLTMGLIVVYVAMKPLVLGILLLLEAAMDFAALFVKKFAGGKKARPAAAKTAPAAPEATPDAAPAAAPDASAPATHDAPAAHDAPDA